MNQSEADSPKLEIHA